MRSFVEKFCARAGRRLLSVSQRSMFSNFPGSIRVSEFEVTGLKPLGGFFQPGVTKAGRLSFAGYCNGRKVKVYSAYDSSQVSLRQAIQRTDLSPCFFPEIIAVDDSLILEAWVEGQSVAALGVKEQRDAERKVAAFLAANLSSPDLRDLAGKHVGAFCYLDDYLISRLGTWVHWNVLASFIDTWRRYYKELSTQLPICISHPDLSAANLVIESGSGRLIVIDNELLGVGRGWVIDGRNSLLHADIANDVFSSIPKDFLELTWRLRKIGSALDANDFSQVRALCRE